MSRYLTAIKHNYLSIEEKYADNTAAVRQYNEDTGQRKNGKAWVSLDVLCIDGICGRRCLGVPYTDESLAAAHAGGV